METMKERSRAVAMTVLHMSSHMVSGVGDAARERSRYLSQYFVLAQSRFFFFVFWKPHPLRFSSRRSIFQCSSSRFRCRPESPSSSLARSPRPPHFLWGHDESQDNADTGTSLTNSAGLFKSQSSNLSGGMPMFFVLVQSCGHIDGSLLSTASQKLSGHVRRSGEQVE